MRDMAENFFCLISEHSGFMKHTTNCIKLFKLIANFFPDQAEEKNYGLTQF